MTTTPDPETVREIAREHIRSGRSDIGTTIVKHFGNGALDDEEFFAWEYEVTDAWRRELRTVSWPAEQLQDDGDVRAVAALLELDSVLYLGQRPTDWGDARSELAVRFADRIAALEARDAKGGQR